MVQQGSNGSNVTSRNNHSENFSFQSMTTAFLWKTQICPNLAMFLGVAEVKAFSFSVYATLSNIY